MAAAYSTDVSRVALIVVLAAIQGCASGGGAHEEPLGEREPSAVPELPVELAPPREELLAALPDPPDFSRCDDETPFSGDLEIDLGTTFLGRDASEVHLATGRALVSRNGGRGFWTDPESQLRELGWRSGYEVALSRDVQARLVCAIGRMDFWGTPPAAPACEVQSDENDRLFLRVRLGGREARRELEPERCEFGPDVAFHALSREIFRAVGGELLASESGWPRSLVEDWWRDPWCFPAETTGGISYEWEVLPDLSIADLRAEGAVQGAPDTECGLGRVRADPWRAPFRALAGMGLTLVHANLWIHLGFNTLRVAVPPRSP